MGEAASHDVLVAQLKTLGLRCGDVVMTHASMRRVGRIEGGAQGLLQAQLAVAGTEGTLLMLLGAVDDEPFDAVRTPVELEEMGVLAEVFRTYPGVLVSDHPANRFGSLGKHAHDLLEPTPLHDYYGPGSTLERFCHLKGRVLRLGADSDTVTLTHYAEYLADVPEKARVRRRYVRSDVGTIWIESLDDSDGIAEWPHGEYFERIYIDYKASGAVRVGPVGACNAELFDAQDFVAFAVRWMNRELGATSRGRTGTGSNE